MALRVGGVNKENHYTMDYELWGKFFLAGAQIHYTRKPFGQFRWHSAQKTHDNIKLTASLLDAAMNLTERADFLSPAHRQELLADLASYRDAYPTLLWKQSGRLARLGLPSALVTPVRNLRQKVEKTFAVLRSGM